MAVKRHRLVITEEESVRLIYESEGRVVELEFGPSGAWIAWDDGDQIPWTVHKIAQYRGVPHESTNGAGI